MRYVKTPDYIILLHNELIGDPDDPPTPYKGEFQIRKWLKTRKTDQYGRRVKHRLSNDKTERLIKWLKENKSLSEFYCSECFDTGCQCGGIGLSCHGCCDCRFENPNIINKFQRYEDIKDEKRKESIGKASQ